MGEIIQLSDEESEEIDKALWEYDKEHIKYRLEGSIRLGIRENGRLIAGLNAYMSSFRILYIDTLFVCKEYRRKGYARKLLTETERRAKELGADLIRIDSFDFQGKDFYIAMGYEVVGKYRCEEDGFEEYFFVRRI